MVAHPLDQAAPVPPGTPEYAKQLRYAWRVCSVTSLGLILIGINGSTLNVALPAVVRHFQAGALASSWILVSYLLIITATLVFFGRVADLLGRREIYLAGFALFVTASLLAGFSPTVAFLIVMRGVQALGAAMILANGTVIITVAFPPDRLSQGMGVYIGTLSVAQLAGPTLGGLIAQAAGWQWVFWVNVPAGVVGLLWGWTTLRRVPAGPRTSLDVAGNVIVFAALSAILVALSDAGSHGLSGPVVIAGTLLFLVLLPVLIVVEGRASHPVLDPRLFGRRMLAFANLASFCTALSRSALVLLIALYFQAARGMDAFEAALGVLPVPVGMALASPTAGALGRRVSPYALSVGGGALNFAGLVCLTLSAGAATPYWVIGTGLFLAGCGNGAFLTGNTTQVMSALPPGGLGVVNGFRLMIMNAGIVLSVAMSLSVLTSTLAPPLRNLVYAGTLARLSPTAVQQLLSGFQRTYLVLTVLALAGLVTAACARPDPGRPAGEEKAG
ncbi:MFS transporter [Sphaerisporangium siamense]|uniref:EmrB/QacA subfamily drug resistance transporter n=1 Tax=Sphaerisporangium siamense TaxID=795645 RepID=A0A7W7G795_9ACTN|nr:MFS transporter [Sphaerisporangium siamense]MBB4700388.1 EmrB/QacA subfamily drug resistance transporter [Sphaerisporangium siamense]GII87808.1 MFS transporter [Sphaerisporangium siamense]